MATAGTNKLAHLDPPDARSFSHVPGLDGVRAFAVIFVMALHYGVLFNRSARGAFAGGFIGVDVFFVLSGFLITSLLVREKAATGGLSFRRFYIRRALRLLPAMFGFLAVNLAFVSIIGENVRATLRQSVYVIFYVSNFAQSYFDRPMFRSSLSLTWSLSIEEQFYLIWPALLLFGILRFARSRNQVLLVIGLGALASALIRAGIYNDGLGYPAAYIRTDAHADGLLIGAGAALLWRWRMVPLRYLNQLATISALGLVAIAILYPKTNSAMFLGGFTAVALMTAIVILGVVENRFSLMPVVEWAPLRTLGRVSYGVYLYHALGLRIAARHIPHENAVPLTIAGLSVAAVLVATSWFVIEQPFLRLKDRITTAS